MACCSVPRWIVVVVLEPTLSGVHPRQLGLSVVNVVVRFSAKLAARGKALLNVVLEVSVCNDAPLRVV